MHNVVVPLIDNPAAFRDSPRDLLTQHGEKARARVCVRLAAKLHLSRSYKCIRAVISLHTHQTRGMKNTWNSSNWGCLFRLCVSILQTLNTNFRTKLWMSRNGGGWWWSFEKRIFLSSLKKDKHGKFYFLDNKSHKKKDQTPQQLCSLS